MKRLFCFIFLVSVNCYGETLNVHWENVETTTCETGNDIIVPIVEPVAKYGYHFVGWKRGLRRIEYLQKNKDTAHIETGYVPNNKTKVRIKLNMQEATGGIIFGYYVSEYDSYRFFNHGNKIYFDYGGLQNRIIGGQFYNNVTYDFLLGPKYVKNYENNTILAGSEQNFSYPFSKQLLFGGDNRTYGKIFLLQIYDENILVKDFIPVLDNNGIPCMFDKVEGKFYYNAGTGQFIAGPVIDVYSSDKQIYSPGDTIIDACEENNIYFHPIYEPNQHICSPGYYLPANVDSCMICPQNHYCVGGTYTFNETIDQGITSCPSERPFAPIGASVCYPHILHIGDDVVFLKSTKLTTPSLNVGMDDGIFYANMTTTPTRMNNATEHYLKIEYDNQIYYVCDDTIYTQ